ncbi:hypothetical protein GCM10028773_08560 [Spirosoma koreense]
MPLNPNKKYGAQRQTSHQSQPLASQRKTLLHQCQALARWYGVGLAIAGLLAGCTDHQNVPRAAATATLINSSGSVGVAQLAEDSDGLVSLTVTVSGLPAGKHGIHFHAIGVAQPQDVPAFNSSGSHYNPASHQHGLNNPMGAHAGDLPNLVVDSQGNGTLITTTNRITLSDGPLTLFDKDGSALIIHAGEDDQMTDPTGNSGARIAGGVVVRK